MAARKHRAGKPERISGLQTAADRAQALDIIVRAFQNPVDMERHMDRSLWRGPIFRPEHTRVVVADGRVVSVVVMAPRRVRFGPVTVPAMTVGPVATHDRQRSRGYSSAAMEDASRYMRANGILLAYLQGLRGFYHRFGYFPYCVSGGINVPRDDLSKLALPGRLRPMTRRDLPRVARLYEEATADRIMTAARDKTVWEWLIRAGTRSWLFHKPQVILDGKGKPCGYLTTHPKGALGLTEFVVLPRERCWRAACGALVRAARKREVKEIPFPLSWDEPMAVFLRQNVPTDAHLRSSPNGGSLLQIVDFPALMKALEPLLTERWRRAKTAIPRARFTLECETGSVCVTAAGSRVAVGGPMRGPRVRVPRRWMSGLVTGHYAVRDLLGKKGVVMPSSARPALDILFPAGWPHVYRADNY